MSETGLSVIKPENFLALAEGSSFELARQENGEGFGLSTLVRVKTPTGGATSWEVDDGLGNVTSVQEITGALVLYRKQAVLWGREGEAIEGVKPYLRSDDHPSLAVGYLVDGGEVGDLDPDLIEMSRIPGTDTYDIRNKKEGGNFHYAEWGTKLKGNGKRLKEQRLIGVLRTGDMFPLLLTVQPGSLTEFKTVISRLAWPFWQSVVTLRLEKAKNEDGQAYSKIMIRVAPQPLPLDFALRLKATYTDPLNAAITSREIVVEE